VNRSSLRPQEPGTSTEQNCQALHALLESKGPLTQQGVRCGS